MTDRETRLDATEIKDKATRSVKWTFLTEILSRISAPVAVLILARLLTPADFGIVAVATLITTLAQLFQTLGLEHTLIQRQTDIKAASNVVFWTNVAISGVLYIIVYAAAPLIASFFGETSAVPVIRVLTLTLVLTGFYTVHSALLQREFRFKDIFVARSANSVIPLIVTIPLAFLLHNVWALVAGTLAGSITQLVLFWHRSKWRPTLSYDMRVAGAMMGFGIWVTLESFFGWTLNYGDNLIVGHTLGAYELGIYTVGWNLIALVFGSVMNPLLPIAYASFSRLQTNLDAMKATFLKLNKLILTLVLPVGAGLVVTAQPLASLFFGQKWAGIDFVIASVGLMVAISWAIGLNAELYRAVGRADLSVKLWALEAIYSIPVWVFAAPKGLAFLCIARLAVFIPILPLHFFVTNRVLGVPLTYLKPLVRLPLVATLLMAVLTYVSVIAMNPFIGWSGWIKFGCILVLAVGIYVLTLWLLDKEYVTQAYKLVRAASK